MPKRETMLRLRTLLRLFRYVFQYRWRIIAGVVLSIFVSVFNLFSITAFVPIFNAFGDAGKVRIFEISAQERERYEARFSGADEADEGWQLQWTSVKLSVNGFFEDRSVRDVIFILAGTILIVYLLKLVFVTITIYLIGTAGLMAIRDLRLELYAKLNRLGLDFFTRERTGSIMSRTINDVQVIGKSISTEFSDAVMNLFYIVTHFALLAFVSWKMLLLGLFIIPIVMAPVTKFAEKIRRAAMGQQQRLAELGAHIHEIVSGIRVIRAFSMENFEKERFQAVNERLYQNTFLGHYYHQVGPALVDFASAVVVVSFLAWGAFEISNGYLTRGLFFAFFFTLVFVMRPLNQIAVMMTLLNSAEAAAERIFSILDSPDAIPHNENVRAFSGLSKSIRFENVSFQYPGSDKPALQRVSFEICRGETVSLVGASGAGKSTVLDLLLRFYDVTDGAIYFDDCNILDYNVKDIRRAIGLVTQNTFLFNTTIRDNIAYGRENLPDEAIYQAARAAHAHDFIMRFPEGYHTMVGERGVMLSGGQRQRLAIARAILQDPPILILDEATSNLDNESELVVQEALEGLLRDRTVITVAHRLSTVYKSDRIYVFDKGQIVEAGKHSALIEQGQLYKKLYELQFTESVPTGA